MRTYNILLLVILAVLSTVMGCAEPVNSAPAAQSAAPVPGAKKTYRDLIVGFAQLGSESEWRVADTVSIQEAAQELGVTLEFSNAQQKQENQIAALRTFIAEKVDVIGISPIVETGWDAVFEEAKAAGIPIIIVDRRAAVNENLYATYLGSDFEAEGQKAGQEMARLLNGHGNVVELVGTIGSAPANDRYKGFREIINPKAYPNIKIIDSQSGDFTVAKGKEVMAAFLQAHGKNISALFSHNDEMSLGAIQAIEEYGLRPGVDIKIVSVDASHGAFEAMIAGKMNVTVECNPLLGPEFFEYALKVVNGEPVPKWVPSKEDIFYPNNAKEILPTRKYLW